MSVSDLERLCDDTEEVSEELQKVDEWMRANKLSLNVEKSVIFLGMHIDERLNYSDQTCVVNKKLSQVIGIM